MSGGDERGEVATLTCCIRRWCLPVAALVALTLLVVCLPLYAWADTGPGADVGADVDTGACSLTLNLGDGEQAGMSGGVIALFRVAALSDDGASYDCSKGQFAGCEAVQPIPTLDSAGFDAQNASIAADLEREIAAGGIEPLSQQTVHDDAVSFDGLDAGLYLVFQTKASDGNLRVTSFLVSLPDAKGETQVVAKPKHGVTGSADPKDPEPPAQSKPVAKGSTTRLPTSGDTLPVTALALFALTALAMAAIAARKA